MAADTSQQPLGGNGTQRIIGEIHASVKRTEQDVGKLFKTALYRRQTMNPCDKRRKRQP